LAKGCDTPGEMFFKQHMMFQRQQAEQLALFQKEQSEAQERFQERMCQFYKNSAS